MSSSQTARESHQHFINVLYIADLLIGAAAGDKPALVMAKDHASETSNEKDDKFMAYVLTLFEQINLWLLLDMRASPCYTVLSLQQEHICGT